MKTNKIMKLYMPAFQKTRDEQIGLGNTKQSRGAQLNNQHRSTATLQYHSTSTLKYRSTATPQHCNTAALQHCNTAALQHCNTAALQHCNTAALQHHSTAALQYRSTATPQHCSTATHSFKRIELRTLSDQSCSAQLFFCSSNITGGLYSFKRIELRTLSDCHARLSFFSFPVILQVGYIHSNTQN